MKKFIAVMIAAIMALCVFAACGGNTLRLHKMEVKVIGEYGGVTALQDDISYYQVAYGEDRAVSEGDVVMQYLD